MIGTKRKEKMIRILSIILLILLVNCTTTNTSNNSEKPKSSMDTVIEAFKRIPFPNM
jgi:uncharacterized membrane protein YadS